MTFSEAKAKLHNYIDCADERQLLDMLSMIGAEGQNSGVVYDDATLDMLRKRSEDVLSGKIETYPVEESIARLRFQFKKNV